MKIEFQVLVNEIKSMTEIISILKEDLKYYSATSHERKPISACSSQPAKNSLYCFKCYELETQLKDTLSELSSVKLITEILNEESKVLKQAPHKDATTNSPWLHPRSRDPHGPAIVQPPIVVPTTHGIPVASQYALPVANRFDALLKRHESQEPRDSIFPTKLEQS